MLRLSLPSVQVHGILHLQKFVQTVGIPQTLHQVRGCEISWVDLFSAGLPGFHERVGAILLSLSEVHLILVQASLKELQRGADFASNALPDCVEEASDLPRYGDDNCRKSATSCTIMLNYVNNLLAHKSSHYLHKGPGTQAKQQLTVRVRIGTLRS